MPEISVVVPVYNVEKYLTKCIESILGQTYRDLEVILVDDGSTDGCAQMCDTYSKQDSRVSVIHKENGGLSDARNVGIDAAKGEYIGFVDSDDYIESDMYETLYRNLIDNDADVAVCGVYNCYKNVTRVECPKEHHLILDNKEALREVLKGEIFTVHAVNKLYKRSCFKDIKYPVNKITEDAFVTPTLLSNCSKVVVDTTPKYYYAHREGSITSSTFKKNDFDIIEAYSYNLKMVREKFPQCRREAEYRYIWAHAYVLDKMMLSEEFADINEFNKLLAFLRRNIFHILFNPCFLWSRKVASVVLLFSKALYKRLLVHNRMNTLKLNS